MIDLIVATQALLSLAFADIHQILARSTVGWQKHCTLLLKKIMVPVAVGQP